MTTMYLIFASQTTAQAASANDWAVRVLGHPTPASDLTQFAWGILSNSAGTLGIIADNVPRSWLSAAEQAGLVDGTNTTVQAVLAQAAIAPHAG